MFVQHLLFTSLFALSAAKFDKNKPCGNPISGFCGDFSLDGSLDQHCRCNTPYECHPSYTSKWASSDHVFGLCTDTSKPRQWCDEGQRFCGTIIEPGPKDCICPSSSSQAYLACKPVPNTAYKTCEVESVFDVECTYGQICASYAVGDTENKRQHCQCKQGEQCLISYTDIPYDGITLAKGFCKVYNNEYVCSYDHRYCGTFLRPRPRDCNCKGLLNRCIKEKDKSPWKVCKPLLGK